MKWKATPFIAGTAPLGLALIVAGCASSASGSPNSSGPYGSAATPSAERAAAGAPTVRIANSPLGRILVDGGGRTLYLFEKDRRASSTCDGACASIWPPLTIKGAPRAGRGVAVGKVATTKRKDGTLEVTYNRHPLYYYVGDTKRGDTNGQGLDQFGAKWYVLSPAGKTVERRG